tara:strand:+ start:3387 stop:4628 length:1242 start_codon:yes stop_codon:yes gene_type:complete
LSVSKTTLKLINWWYQFPLELRLITRGRFFASLGAGGVIYLTSLIFNKLGLSASEIGTGFGIAALAGTISRLITGKFLDKGISFYQTLKLAAIIAMIGDLVLFNSQTYFNYLNGQFLIGTAGGVYWPSAELGIPASCKHFSSAKGFALARSGDAIGTSIGTLIGSLSTYLGTIRSVYIMDIICMTIFICLLFDSRIYNLKNNTKTKNLAYNNNKYPLKEWLPKTYPILFISIISTGIFALIQSILPLDLVKGGIMRPALSESWSSILIFLQLTLLVIFQWPIGKYVAKRNPYYGLKISLINFSLGCLFLSLSSIVNYGIVVIIIAQVPIAIALASFLPTATEAIIRITPHNRQGISMAIYSQCFSISGLAAPYIGGKLIDIQGNCFSLWLGLFVICLSTLLLIRKQKSLTTIK